MNFFISEMNAIQVCVNISEKLTRQREIAALERLDSFEGLNRMGTITIDEKGSHKTDNGKVIEIIPIYEWLTK